MNPRRECLEALDPNDSTHAGLWLDKFLRDQTVDKKSSDKVREKSTDAATAKARLMHELRALKTPPGYDKAFARRRERFGESVRTVRCHTAKTLGRLVVGLGQKGPAEVGVALEHTWGVPILPGSALKGLVAATAHQLLLDPTWHKPVAPGSALAALVGTLQHRGGVWFHDAWWNPADLDWPLWPDVMTVHHTAQSNDQPPIETESPMPIPFVSVSGSFLVAVEVASVEEAPLLDAALEILRQGLNELGLGAKTNAGYGRMTLDYTTPAEAAQDEAKQRAAQREKDLAAQQQKQ